MRQIKYIIFHIHINPSIVENIRSQRVLVQLKCYFYAISRPKRQISEKLTLLIITQRKEKTPEKVRTPSSTVCQPMLLHSERATRKSKCQFLGAGMFHQYLSPCVSFSLSLSLKYFFWFACLGIFLFLS